MATVVESKTLVGEERLLLTGMSWDFYKRFCDELEGRSAVRLIYSEGMLEITVIKRSHEFYKKMLAKMVEQIVFVFNMPVASGGSMTIQREDLEKGFEHDECWWIEHESDVRGRGELDFRHDPPPDLAIEVEVSSSLLDKVSIFAAIGVPEIWRFDGKNLRFLVLQDNGEYQENESSRRSPSSSLSLGQIHAALSYYFDNRQTILDKIRQDDKAVAAMKRQVGPGPLEQKRQSQNGNPLSS